MTTSAIRVYSLTITLPSPFTTSLGTTSEKEEIILQVEDEGGAVGWGEASPSTTILSSTSRSITAALDGLAPALIGKDSRLIERLTFEMDRLLRGKLVRRLLGGYEVERVDTDYTVSMAKENVAFRDLDMGLLPEERLVTSGGTKGRDSLPERRGGA